MQTLGISLKKGSVDPMLFIALSEAEEQGGFDRVPFSEPKRSERDKSLSGNGGMREVKRDRHKKPPAVFRKQRAGRGHVIDIG